MAQSMFKPMKRLLYVFFGIFINTVAVGNDQFVKIPRKQLLEGLPGQISIEEGVSTCGPDWLHTRDLHLYNLEAEKIDC